MATTAEDLAVRVKTALSSGHASASTVTTLQTLLASGGLPDSATRNNASKATFARNTKELAPSASTLAVSRRSKNTAHFEIREDEERSLSAKARYALATDVVNVSLKALSSAAKSLPRRPSSAQHASTPAKASATPHGVLQPRSENATPLPQPSAKQSASHGRVSQASNPPSTPGSATYTAECARLAFSCLRALDMGKTGLRELPRFQLETGMLSLCGRLLGLEIYTLATKELYCIRRRLHDVLSPGERVRPLSRSAETEPLPSLLQLDVTLDTCPEAWPLLITYQLHALHVIIARLDPSLAQDVLENLSLEAPSSLPVLVLRQANSSGDIAKASKQLASIATMILRLSPSVATTADETAKDRAQSPTPIVSFNLQILALRVRQEAWRLENRQPNVEKDIMDPVSRCLSAMVRRQSIHETKANFFHAGKAACESLGLFEAPVVRDSSAAYTTFRTLSVLAEAVSLNDEAQRLADEAVKRCEELGRTHPRYLAAVTRQICMGITSEVADTPGSISNMSDLCTGLHECLSGSCTDCEMLLEELLHLLRQTQKRPLHEKIQRSLAGAVAMFTLRFSRCFPGKNVSTTQEIVRLALALSGSHENHLSWVSQDACQILIEFGVLRTIGERSNSGSISLVWSSFSSAVALGRMVKIVVLKGAGAEPQNCLNFLMDNEQMGAVERGALLEWQLECLMHVAHKPRYQHALQLLLPEILSRLESIYNATNFPIRRARVASLALRAYAQHSGFLPTGLTSAFADIHVDWSNLGNDDALKDYLADIRVSLTVSRQFLKGCPTRGVLKEALHSWRAVLDRSKDCLHTTEVVDNPLALLAQLSMLEEYFCAMGDDKPRLLAAQLVCDVSLLLDHANGRLYSTARLARACLALGLAEKAGHALSSVTLITEQRPQLDIGILDYSLCQAEHMLALDRVHDSRAAIQATLDQHEQMKMTQSRALSGHPYRILYVRAWHLASRYFFATGYAKKALRAAKRSVQAMNGLWSAIERAESAAHAHSMQDVDAISDEPAIENLTSKVSKLELKPKSQASSGRVEARGAAFWPLLRLTCASLMHLCDIYVHYGIFNDANHASEQAVKFAESVGSSQLVLRMRIHRSSLLAAAGRFDDAELCLALDEVRDISSTSLIELEYQRARAALSLKRCEHDEARMALKKALAVIETLRLGLSEENLTNLPDGSDTQLAPLNKTNKSKRSKPQAPRSTQPIAGQATKSRRAGPVVRKNKTKTTVASPSAANPETHTGLPHMLAKIKADLMLEEELTQADMGHLDIKRVTTIESMFSHISTSFKMRLLRHHFVMSEVGEALQKDVSFSVLPESTLSLPALQRFDRRSLTQHTASASLRSPTANQSKSPDLRTTKSAAKGKGSNKSLAVLLSDARGCLTAQAPMKNHLSTVEVHHQYSLLADLSMLASTTSGPASTAQSVFHPTQEAFNVEFPRIHASRGQVLLALLDKTTTDQSAWPSFEDSIHVPATTAKTFQDQYIDIIPRTWTAVSISMNQSCDELYIAKYHRSQSPLILRLPFARQQSDDAEQDIFDFESARSELREIIELSNYSCHSSLDTSAKGAKTRWWAERDALDKRLQELLINMENIWIGGFKGIFSPDRRSPDHLCKFRRSFEAILDRNLPSRRADKRGSNKMTLDDQVLYLFVGLGAEPDDETDIEELFSELLYFVVDILQFNGERNAYDEVDFDSMAVEMLDAVRVYSEAESRENANDGHLILVLDRRLQCFPWESLPCMGGRSVSRVDSMLSLRDRILEMRKRSGNEEDIRHTVTQKSGSYILNPSSDLKDTEAMLNPLLAKLNEAEGAEWQSFVGKEPSEEDFKSALSTSPLLLYFGHGSGSQYIRPRTVRRLDRCSEVVWLMGCSSGAVTEYGDLEPFAVPLAYLSAGQEEDSCSSGSGDPSPKQKCMAVVATLWDVTDKDIDRFSQAVGEGWGLWGAEQGSSKLPPKTPKKRERVNVAATPERAPKTPKTPKVHRTPAPARTPARSRSRPRKEPRGKQSLVEAVSNSRDACCLRYLNGAAPVVYGVPVYLED